MLMEKYPSSVEICSSHQDLYSISYDSASSLIPSFTTTLVHSFKLRKIQSRYSVALFGDLLAGFGNYQFRYPVALSGDSLASLTINNLVILVIDYQVFQEKLLRVNGKQSRKVNSN
ncbi:hypothetical protein PV325_004573 [Microctonus aethiopoides]|uniref:Uncharacterized protein n=1 Tax=Microctonus aethiopoides TaxID=144406 RepID=A0AA39FNH1_9HYME|nr:hypothetical protein PV325_004573 [Microctonus aethiopoides]KAK0085857.1 hypothetical protein PV326_005759 [Microctonus aethiopoides]KAK0172867.1 hypothetical protein PV328_006134 [Microctonus aethiopoides]